MQYTYRMNVKCLKSNKEAKNLTYYQVDKLTCTLCSKHTC